MRTLILFTFSLILFGCTPPTIPTLTPVSVLPTLEPPTATNIPTDTPPTDTTPTGTNRPAGTPTLGAVASAIPFTCNGLPSGWTVEYIVQSGDTLSILSQYTGISVADIMVANCLDNDRILAGQTLNFPSMLASPTATITNTPQPDSTQTSTLTPTPTIVTAIPPGPGGERVEIAPPSGLPGTIFTVQIESFQPNEAITLRIIFAETFELIVQELLIVNAQGNYIYLYASPADASDGGYLVQAVGDEAQADGEFTIVGNTVVTTNTPIPTLIATPLPTPTPLSTPTLEPTVTP